MANIKVDDFAVEYKVEEIATSFQVLIQQMMKKSGTSKAELADRMGVSASRVSQLLNGLGANLTLKSIAKALVALDVDAEIVERRGYISLLRKRRSKGIAVKAHGLARSNTFWKNTTANENKHPIERAA